ncbi:hypothetical protein BC936DRAFT_144146 [Jimgerdemannia flammicorona]|uniref:Uncharacterized protein n=1 Tax=Jimgerdemannia flammicorona TaxID=994334 RepID=A0A433DD20_9FUNG|nr:hypothetical protein BC936DRAFT_144146 [Jimgerdemannia flammicorona]
MVKLAELKNNGPAAFYFVAEETNKSPVLMFLYIPIPEQFGLQGPESFLYTSKSGCLDVDGIDDVADYSSTIVTWAVAKFSIHLIRRPALSILWVARI